MAGYAVYLIHSHPEFHNHISRLALACIIGYIALTTIAPLTQKGRNRKDVIEKKFTLIIVFIMLIPMAILYAIQGVQGLWLGLALFSIILFGFGGLAIIYMNILKPENIITLTDTGFIFNIRGFRSYTIQGKWSEVSGISMLNPMGRKLYFLILILPDTSPLYTRYPYLQKNKTGMGAGMLGSPLAIPLNLLNVSGLTTVCRSSQHSI